MNKSRTMLYGASGAGKTTICAGAARWIYETTGKRTAVTTAENHEGYKRLVQEGIVDILIANNYKWPYDTLHQATLGSRPLENGKLAKPAPDTYGMWIFEGCSSFAELLIGASVEGGIAARTAKGEVVGAQGGIMFQDGNRKVGANTPNHYGIVQGEIRTLIHASQTLPGHVIWTTHEAKADDEERGNKPVKGPEIIGSAMTPRVQKWFQNLLHVYTVDKKQGEGISREFRVYLKPHFGPEDLVTPYQAVVRVVDPEKWTALEPYVVADRDTFKNIITKLETLNA